MPVFVSIEPANICNLHCPECPVGNTGLRSVQSGSHTPPKFIPVPLYKNILRQLVPYIHTVQLFFQGEPLLNRNLPLLVRLAHSQGLYTIVSTNAQLLTPPLASELIRAGLNRLILSIDGITEQSYSAYRQGGSLKKAIDGLKAAVAAKKQLHANTVIEWQCLRLKSNEKEWETIKRCYKDYGADRLVFKTAQLYDYADGNPLMPSCERNTRYSLSSDGKYHIRRPWWKSSVCRRLFTGCVINTAGEVLPCCFDKSSLFPFGSLFRHSFAAVWHSAAADAFRRKVLSPLTAPSLHSRPAICNNCTE